MECQSRVSSKGIDGHLRADGFSTHGVAIVEYLTYLNA